jgi:hypothetical protein
MRPNLPGGRRSGSRLARCSIMRTLLVVVGLLVASTVAASPANESFEGTVTSVGLPAPALCGILMATQTITLRVTKVVTGTMTVGSLVTVNVVVCGSGSHLVKHDIGWKLDPKQIRPGAKLSIDDERSDNNYRLVWRDTAIRP